MAKIVTTVRSISGDTYAVHEGDYNEAVVKGAVELFNTEQEALAATQPPKAEPKKE